MLEPIEASTNRSAPKVQPTVALVVRSPNSQRKVSGFLMPTTRHTSVPIAKNITMLSAKLLTTTKSRISPTTRSP